MSQAPVDRLARLPAPLMPHAAARIVKHYAERVGPDPAAYASRSLRSGFLTSAAKEA